MIETIPKLTVAWTAFAASTIVAAAQVLDQSFQPSLTGQWIATGTSSERALAQTFEVGVAGTLTRFEAYISDPGGALPVLWDIRPTSLGVPVQSDVASLASGTFLSSAAPRNGYAFYAIELGSSSIPCCPEICYQ